MSEEQGTEAKDRPESGWAVLAQKLTSTMAFVIYGTFIGGNMLLRLYTSQESNHDPTSKYTVYGIWCIGLIDIVSIWQMSRLSYLKERRKYLREKRDGLTPNM